MADSEFTRESLKLSGFSGWCAFADLRSTAPPKAPGVYVVHREITTPTFRDTNPGGRFKGKDPTINSTDLNANWVENAAIIYIGKANDLRRRLAEFASFGSGKPIGHWGGRLIWQLSDAESFTVAWKETPLQDPRDVEAKMIDRFRSSYGKPPFANDPHLLGR